MEDEAWAVCGPFCGEDGSGLAVQLGAWAWCWEGTVHCTAWCSAALPGQGRARGNLGPFLFEDSGAL